MSKNKTNTSELKAVETVITDAPQSIPVNPFAGMTPEQMLEKMQEAQAFLNQAQSFASTQVSAIDKEIEALRKEIEPINQKIAALLLQRSAFTGKKKASGTGTGTGKRQESKCTDPNGLGEHTRHTEGGAFFMCPIGVEKRNKATKAA